MVTVLLFVLHIILHFVDAAEIGGIYVEPAPIGGERGIRMEEKERLIQFKLFTRLNPAEYELLKVNDSGLLEDSNLDMRRPTVVFFDGFLSGERSTSTQTILRAYMRRGDHNFILVDWSTLAAAPWYYVAARNARVAGAYTGEFIDYLVSRGIPLESFHVMGISLGAHAAGFVGKYVTSGKLRRITGLDPASFLFEQKDSTERIDSSDAEFVDIIHTSASPMGGLALEEPLGHADFYPNSGFAPQPGCWSYITEDLCSHWRAWQLYAESLRYEEGFPATSCDSWDEYENGTCHAVSSTQVFMGIACSQSARGRYYLKTGPLSPYSKTNDILR